jgi:hypothetical protein
MELYRVTKPVELNTGLRIKLTQEQAVPRLSCLKPLKADKYEIKRPVQFKRGEVIGIEEAFIKPFLGMLEVAEPPSPQKAAKR